MESAPACEQCEALLPDYVLEVLEPQEVASVTGHLRTCTRCQASLEAYETALVQLALAVPQYEPPAEVRQRLLSRVQAELAPPVVAVPRHGWQRWRWVLVTAANVVLVLGAVWWAWQAWQEVASVRRQWAGLAQELALQRRALAILTAPGARRVLLRSDVAGSRARALLSWQPDTAHAVLIVQDLPPLAPDRVYQLWLLWNGNRDNGGIFRVDAQGFGLLEIQAPKPLAAYQAAGITEEPAGGSPGPTSPRLLGARL